MSPMKATLERALTQPDHTPFASKHPWANTPLLHLISVLNPALFECPGRKSERIRHSKAADCGPSQAPSYRQAWVCDAAQLSTEQRAKALRPVLNSSQTLWKGQPRPPSVSSTGVCARSGRPLQAPALAQGVPLRDASYGSASS